MKKTNFIDEIDFLISEYNNDFDGIQSFSTIEDDIINYSKKNSLGINASSFFKNILSRNRTYLFNGVIITAYGRFEKRFKELVKTFIRFSIKAKTISAKDIRKEQLSSALKLIERMSEEEQKQLADGLYEMYVNDNVTAYNEEISLFYYQNLKSSEISKICKMVCLNNCVDLVIDSPYYLSEYASANGLCDVNEASTVLGAKKSKLEEIDSFVEIRNAISHTGTANNSTILSTNEFKRMHLLVRAFLISFAEIIKGKMFEELKGKLKPVTLINTYYDDVVGLNSGKRKICSKNYYVVEERNNRFYVHNILEIKYQNASVIKTPTGVDVTVKIQTDHKINNNSTYYLAKKDIFCYK